MKTWSNQLVNEFSSAQDYIWFFRCSHFFFFPKKRGNYCLTRQQHYAKTSVHSMAFFSVHFRCKYRLIRSSLGIISFRSDTIHNEVCDEDLTTSSKTPPMKQLRSQQAPKHALTLTHIYESPEGIAQEAVQCVVKYLVIQYAQCCIYPIACMWSNWCFSKIFAVSE